MPFSLHLHKFLFFRSFFIVLVCNRWCFHHHCVLLKATWRLDDHFLEILVDNNTTFNKDKWPTIQNIVTVSLDKRWPNVGTYSKLVKQTLQRWCISWREIGGLTTEAPEARASGFDAWGGPELEGCQFFYFCHLFESVITRGMCHSYIVATLSNISMVLCNSKPYKLSWQW